METDIDHIEDETPNDAEPKTPKFSPPYKRIRALRLFNDAHHNPKALKNCSTSLFTKFISSSPIKADSNLNKSNLTLPSVNINPFSPEGAQLSQKRSYNQTHSDCGSPELYSSRKSLDLTSDETEDDTILADTSMSRRQLRESNISRYHEEFHDMELIGTGQFASVYKCINRLDGYAYAIKKSARPIHKSSLSLSLKEVYALAVLGKHPHVVSYFSAWLENDHMIIQNEYCNGGSLADKIAAYVARNASSPGGSRRGLDVADIRKLLRQVADGLAFIHAQGLVHLDIKPSNIFVSREKRYGGGEAEGEADGDEDAEEVEVYKIGDLGHVTSTTLSPYPIEEGDCRYLSTELLREDYSLLPAADMFALGISALEASGYHPLPRQGEDWHRLRQGWWPEQVVTLTGGLVRLLKCLMDPDASRRLTAVQVVKHEAVQVDGYKSNAQLYRELTAEKVKNDFLQKQLLASRQCLPKPKLNQPADSTKVGGANTKASSRLVGKHVCRSNSTTNF